mmetsp:Transcript_34568/g.81498  ORF Transcript_34568/g.81498 Transcript_34568/m.81498 type:complete len:259 (+) Transcript_34568:123-899(+)|eukprot:CAMPEP_0172394360 /NCGR_PEP_ID=MMETSP1061-20121228/14440_1 /TAXON_ID=37318 /ORGANISM="Pseudo-nitzschia pungens, Strain cf. pungens" /LENGTH=258 /DNA_ID=CAMNT_0013125687 /DNA_START=82 /DNA_END=858 /DNA_ORIENTATION=+
MPSHSYEKTKVLNNYAATLIESGKFVEAISLLKFTLKYLKQSSRPYSGDTCVFRNCVWEGSTISEKNAPKESDKIPFTIASSSGKTIPIDPSPKRRASNVTKTLEKNRGTAERDCYIKRTKEHRHRWNHMHTRPIRVRCEGDCSTRGIHPFVTFNIALAHHLKAFAIMRIDRVPWKHELKKALALYRLAYEMQRDNNIQQQKKCHEPNNVHASSCLRFGIMLLYNIGHIHRLLNDTKKYRRCLEELLSIEMILADSDN